MHFLQDFTVLENINMMMKLNKNPRTPGTFLNSDLNPSIP